MWPFVIEINFKLTFFREYFNEYMYNMITISRFQSYSMKRLYRKTIHFLFFQIASIFKVFLVYFIQNSDQRNIALIFIITIQTSHLFNIGDHSQFFLSVEQNLIFLYLSMWFSSFQSYWRVWYEFQVSLEVIPTTRQAPARVSSVCRTIHYGVFTKTATTHTLGG